MRKFITVLWILLLVVATVSVAQVPKKALQNDVQKEVFNTPQAMGQIDFVIKPTSSTKDVLFTQMSPVSTATYACQDFETANDAADLNAADDFPVTGGPWDINAVRWIGGMWNGGSEDPNAADGFNIAFYADVAGTPSETPIAGSESYVTEYTYAAGVYQAALPSTVTLADGTYWISIQGVVDFGIVGQYGWVPIDNTAPINGYFHRKDIGGFWAGTGLWDLCTIAPWNATGDYDLCFELLDALPLDPILVVDPGLTVDFGNTAIGNTVSQLFLLQNIGGGTLTISSIVNDISSNVAYSLANVYGVPGVLPPDSVSFVVNFTPTATGVVSATINITDDLTKAVTQVNISGKGVVPPANDDCTSPTPIAGPYPQTILGTTIDATADCFDDYTVWYTVDLPYELNLVSLNFCGTPDVLGTGIYSVYPYLGIDCSCAWYSYDILDWNQCTADFAPYYEFWYIPGPGTATLPVTVMDPTGIWEMDFQFDVDVRPYISTDLTVFLEGPYTPLAEAGLMATDLNAGGYLPVGQPYNPPLPYYGNNTPKWLHTGTETADPIPAANIVDWVVVELRDADVPANAASDSTIARAAGFLLEDGSIVDLDGTSDILWPFVSTDINYGLYVVVYQRNHLGIMSNFALTDGGGGIYAYDFSTGETQVFGDAAGHKELEPGVWGMIAADGDADGFILGTDKTTVWLTDVNVTGYLGGDYNLNATGQPGDMTDIWLPNGNKAGQVPLKSSDGSLLNMNQGYKSQIPD